ncbi:MAG: NAD(P)-binding protein, partial [Hyphomicrobiaceae bacterium]
PALTGLRGMTDAAFEVMHAVAREGRSYPLETAAISEDYDLVVVGAGLAGLTAAFAYKERHPKARILILDNNDDFGGHARRCEFDAGGRMLLGYGGSESMVSPRTQYAGELGALLARLGIDPERFYDETVFHRTLYPGLGLSRGVYFDAETFGTDKLVTGDPMILGFDEFAPGNPNARDITSFLADCPLDAETRVGLDQLFAGTRDYLADQDTETKLKHTSRISYRDFLLHVCGLPEQGAAFFEGRLHDNYGLGIDAIAARDAMADGLPGAAAIGIESALDSGHDGEPYVHHFPDGNATIARALVRALVPSVAPSGTIEALVDARFDYARLDDAASDVRIRLSSTAIHVANDKDGGVEIAYVRNGALTKVRAKKSVVATFAAVTGHICPELKDAERQHCAANVRTPLLYIKVGLTNWQSFARLGVHKIAAPKAFLSTVKLDYPVSFGDYRFARSPAEPIGLQLVHVPLAQNEGHDARTQFRMGRQWLLDTPFERIEQMVRTDLQRMLGGGGFDADRDITAITVNRWSHGYSYAPSSLFDDVESMTADAAMMREPLGNIVFANSDTAWDAYAHAAMSEALRAVKQIT